MYLTFNKAVDLAHRLGVPTTIETLKTLENAEITKPARPLKRRQQETHVMRPSSSWGAVQGKAAQVKAAAKEKDDDEVSLDFSGDEVADVPMTIGDFQQNECYIKQEVVDDFNIDVDGIIDSYWQVHSSAPFEAATDDIQTELDNIAVCINKLSPFCAPQCECKTSEMQEWMLDSGASFHFSGDINNFVDYTQMEEGIPLRTANSSAVIKGKGTIILALNTGEKVWIYPVFYVPGLTCKLLSLGTFLQDGFQVIGVAHFIKVVRNSSPFLTFKPRSERDSIYVIRALAACDADLHSTVQSIYIVDYEMMHKRLAHPSKDVLQKARKHLKDFPQIEIPSEDHVCPGCAQGKMTNRPFPATTQRASRPFELIHSDLKSFPIESYHRFKYVIVFFDDYSSNAWTVNLRTKDAALTATSQFLTYVELQYGSKVQQWMSDAGGEYKSAAFTKMLKDKGIEILQSIPYVHQQNG